MFDEDDQKSGAAPGASPLVRTITITLAAMLTLGSIGAALDIPRQWFGLLLFPQQIISVLLGLSVALVYLHVTINRGKRGPVVPWYDWTAAVVGLGTSIYISYNYQAIYDSIPYLKVWVIVLAAIMFVLVLEGLRRVAGNMLLGIIVFFILYSMFGYLVPFQDLQARETDYRDLLLYAVFDVQGLIGPILRIALTIVISFLFFGALLFRSGGSHFFTDISLAVMGRFRGGSAKIAVFASALFGSISGSALANVASTGVVTIPLMKKGGYRPDQAGAIEAVASTGGQLMPPIMGAAAFLMAEFLETTYAAVVLAAVIPSVLYYLALFINADLVAAKTGITRVDQSQIPSVGEVMRHGWHFPIPFAILIVALFWWNMPAELAALYGAAALIFFGMVFGYRGRRMNLRSLWTAITATGFLVINIAMIASAAGVIVASLGVTGLGFALTVFLIKLGGGSMLGLLFVAAGISILLGMGMPTLGVYVLLATLIAPALVEVGVAPMAAHLFVLYFGMLSMITPPVAIAAYGAATIAGTDAMKTCVSAVKFGWPAYIIPFLFVFAPSLLFDAPFGHVAFAFVTAILGIWMGTAAVVGFLVRPLHPIVRIVLFVSGVLTLIPAGTFQGAFYTDIAGGLVGLAIIGWEFYNRRRNGIIDTPTPAAAE